MKRIISLVIVFWLLILSLTNCFSGTYTRGDTLYNISWYDGQSIYARLESDSFIFDKNDVTLDFSYGLYQEFENITLDQLKKGYCDVPSEEELQNGAIYRESDFAIYISNSEELVFETKDNGSLIDPKNKVNAKLWKYITFDEAFSTNYGYTYVRLKIKYNYSEKITIPSEFFTPQNNRLYIHIVRLWRNFEGTIQLDYISQNDYYFDKYFNKCSITHMLLGDTVILY